MTAKLDRRALWLAPEAVYASLTGSSPAASTFRAMPVVSLGDLTRGRTIIPTNRMTGQTGETPREPGPDMASTTFGLEMLPFPSAVGDAASPPADDHLDLALGGLFSDPDGGAAGGSASRDGETVTSLVGTTLTLPTDVYNAGDLVFLVNASGEGQWVPIATETGGGVYELAWAPTLSPAPTVAQGSKQWADSNGDDRSVTFEGLYSQDAEDPTNGAVYRLPGSRLNTASLSVSPETLALLSLGLMADSKDDSATASTLFSAMTVATNGDPAVLASTPLRLGCVYVGGVEVETAEIGLDLGIEVSAQVSTCRPNGRSNHRLMRMTPVVTLRPLWSSTLAALLDSQATRSVLIQLGTGTGSMAFYMPTTQAETVASADTNGLQAQTITLGTRTVVAAGDRIRVARA